jgi:hypothetical protein
MTTSYYSTVFEQTADEVWAVIRNFDSYQWAEGVGPSRIENDKPGNAVGAIRSFRYYDAPSRQRLVAHSDTERSYSYESAEPFDTLRYYRLTLRVAPIVDGNKAFVEWSAEFDASRDADRWSEKLTSEFAKSLNKLRTRLA